jgi:hypothetical protein
LTSWNFAKRPEGGFFLVRAAILGGMNSRSEQLQRLIQSLEELVTILRGDPSCSWTSGFETHLSDAQRLQSIDFTQDDLSLLSGSIMSVFGGMGSFNDYVPRDGGYVSPHLLRDFQLAIARVYDDALNLRAVDADNSA